MEAEKDPSPEYIKAFNNGYLLAKHEPELASLLAAQKNAENEYSKRLVSGKQEYDKEIREWAKSFSKGQSSRNDKNLAKER